MLGWAPEVGFRGLVRRMAEADLHRRKWESLAEDRPANDS